MLDRCIVSECLGKLSLLQRFPTNEYALRELAETLNQLCRNDHEATALVNKILCAYDKWPGPCSFRKAYDDLASEQAEREDRERLQVAKGEAIKARNAHEAQCPGYVIILNDEDKTVDVSGCHECFLENDYRLGFFGIRCRRHETLPSGKLKGILTDELGKRPGWRERIWYLIDENRKARGL